MAKRSNRIVFHSSRTSQGWIITHGGRTIEKHATQEENEDAAIKMARDIFSKDGIAQVVFHEENGSIREERTYGEDPERTPG